MRPGSESAFFDVRLRGFRDRAEVATVTALLAGRCHPLPSESLNIADAAGRLLAQEIRSDVAVPGFDRAAMDGFAVRAEETFGAGEYNPLQLCVVGAALPGSPYRGTLDPGQAVRIMTGAPIPAGADAVLPVESAQEEHGVLRITEPVAPGRHVGRRGEDIAPSEVILKPGRVLRPQDLGILASIGAASVEAVRRPVVRILVTGDELLPPGARPDGFKIVDSNSIMLAALARRDGAEVIPTVMLPDRRDLLKEELLQPTGDVILISGGSSTGQEDHAPGLVAELGQLPIHGVALRPASPTGVGWIENRIVFLLPGNPVSCLCAYDLLARVAIQRLGGRPATMPYRQIRLPLAAKIVSAVGRVDYVRVRIGEQGIEPLAVSGASMLSTTTRADGFVLVDRDLEGVAPGELVDVWLYD